MKHNFIYPGFALFLVFFICACSSDDNFPLFKEPYLGQKPPGTKPQLFLPGLISTNYFDLCIGFLKSGRVCVFSMSERGTYFMYEKNNRWTEPKKVPWQNEQGSTDFTAGPDGRTIFFQSSRPTAPDDETREINTWKVEWSGHGWTEPAPLPFPANTEEYWELYPSVTPDGSVYFFTWSRPDSRIGDIYRSEFVGGEFLEAQRLPDPVNSDYYEVDPFVAPDGSYLLFGSGRPGGYSLLDLYISFRRGDGQWSHPVNTGPELNPFCYPTRMSVTPDGQYFFFPSTHKTDIPKGDKVESPSAERWGDYDIYWVSTGFIDDLKRQYAEKKCAFDMVEREYLESGLHYATQLLKNLYTTGQEGHYFELSEFLVLCGRMMAEGRHDDADQFYSALLRVMPEEYRIKQGYAVACILNGKAFKGLNLIKELWSQFPSSRSEDMFIIHFQLRLKSNREDEIEVLRFITIEFPNSPYAFYNLAEAYERYGDVERAIQNCRKALVLKPNFNDAVDLMKKLEEN